MNMPALPALRLRARLVATCLVAAMASSLPVQAQQAQPAPMVRLATAFGPIDIQLDATAPATVANFLAYVRDGSYNGSMLHRRAPNFVVQGGGFRWSDTATPRATAITTRPPVVNEFSPQRSNLRGTVAMAKLGGNPDSATSQWFVNLGDNSANLDNQNGGFTVFGRVTPPSMEAVDRIAALGTVNATVCTAVMGSAAGALNELPVRPPAPTSCAGVTSAQLVLISGATELPSREGLSASDRIFNFLEAAYPQHATPVNQPTQLWEGYTYRYYPATDSYAGTRDGILYYLVPALGPEITPLGTVEEWLAIAAAAGY